MSDFTYKYLQQTLVVTDNSCFRDSTEQSLDCITPNLGVSFFNIQENAVLPTLYIFIGREPVHEEV